MIAQGRLPLLCFLLGFILGFLMIRVSVRLIRAQVRWWPGNLRAGDTHIHHMVFGVILVLTSGIGMISTFDDGSSATGALLAALFGVGAALVLDEFALIYYLRDVYWEEQGRTSVDAVFVALAVTGLLLLGFHPLWLLDINDFRHDPSAAARALVVLFAVVNLILAAIVIAKGKIWTGLFGMFFLPLLVVGALRLKPARRAVGPVALRRPAQADVPGHRAGAALSTSGDPRQDLRSGPGGGQAGRRTRALGRRGGTPAHRRPCATGAAPAPRAVVARARHAALNGASRVWCSQGAPADFRPAAPIWHNAQVALGDICPGAPLIRSMNR